MSNELKPCPFCGGRAHMITRVQAGVPSGDDGYTTVIKCLNHAECGAVICRWALKKKWSVESAIKAWNRRVNDEKRDEKRKYYRKCGICGERHEQSEMIRDNGSPNGWLCMDCHIDRRTEWYI